MGSCTGSCMGNGLENHLSITQIPLFFFPSLRMKPLSLRKRMSRSIVLGVTDIVPDKVSDKDLAVTSPFSFMRL